MAKNFPIGISLGLDHLTSACITHDNQSLPVACVKSSNVWKKFFLDTLRVKRSSEEQREYLEKEGAADIITSALSEIQKATEARIGKALTIEVVCYPEHFRHDDYAAFLARTVYREYPMVKNSAQLKSYLYCASLAYGLNTSEALGYDPGFDIEDSNSLLIYFDYQTEFLEVSIVGVAKYYHVRERWFRIEGFGGTDNIASDEEIVDMKARFRDLLDAQALDHGCGPTQLEDYRRIVFSGEAVASEFEKIRIAVTKVVPDFIDGFRDFIDPQWVSAFGAARMAKENTLNPPVYVGHCF
ncbi:uncharacterized protein LY89DRAFT_778119 [Mollisia scopiformis]|uniref:Uncharacterized protein n=1 Tax=Mollisia scopiformis TaxID=149040 RepID=A0A194XNA3_MOLSC|nr:uncharacterized protein LY89DRAFT_778119 [Mollisia scopiformis]KUJ21735.1 hypothetical protein LY89DRAFT_778119 [Mollisia scopiformis]